MQFNGECLKRTAPGLSFLWAVLLLNSLLGQCIVFSGVDVKNKQQSQKVFVYNNYLWWFKNFQFYFQKNKSMNPICRTLFTFLFFLLLVPNSLLMASAYEVNRGERPPIRFEEVTPSSYDPGVLIIKFSDDVERHLSENPFALDDDGFVRFQMEEVDRLNQKHGVRAARQHFLSSALGNTFTERHKAWGFHLWYRLEVDEKTDIVAMLHDYQRLPEVAIAEPSFKKELIGSHDAADFIPLNRDNDGDGWIPNDPQFVHQWHYHNTGQQNGTPGADISLPQAWEIEKGDTLVIVAVVDGGIDYNHPDLAGNMWYDIGYNFVNDSPNIEPHNHGTHVAGTVAAVNNNNVGVSGVAGGSGADDGVRLMSAQVFAANSNGGFHIAPVWAADNGAAISQNSWGYTSPNYYEQNVLDAIDYFNDNGGGGALAGGITIFSAGNSDTSDPRYPGYYSGAFSVAGTNNQDVKSWYSTYGEWVDVSAPGGETNSVTERGVLSTLNNNSYGYYQGTSMASPHVSGIAALMLSKVYGELDAEEVADILRMTSDNHYAVNPNYIGLLGSGRVNALEALILAELFHILPANPSNFEAIGLTDTEMSISWELNDEEHEVLLAWSVDGQFGSPAENETYAAGDEIPGGGIVLYAGDATSYLQGELEASTLYFYRIWSLGDEGIYSYGRNTDGRTQCGVEELPISEAFGAGIPYCWEFEPTQGNWGISTGQGNPAPGMQFSWSPSLSNYSHRLVTAPYEGDIPGSAIALEFDMMLDNYSMNTVEYLSVEVWTGGEWQELMEFDNTGGDIAWDTYLVDLTPWALDNVFMVGFRAHGSNSYNINRWVIDNIQVFSYSCPPPYDLSAHDIDTESAMIVWESAGEESLWNLIWGEQGFDPDQSGTLVEGLTSTGYLLEDLDVFTDYDVYVLADCGDDDLSVWAGPLSFKTLATCPAPVDLFVNNIESTSANVGWTAVGEEGLWDIIYGNTGFNPETGGNMIEGVTENPFHLQGLDAVSTYDVYVRAYCGPDDLSIWTGPATFSTTCGVMSLPYLETFDGNAPDCWTFIDGQGNWGFTSTLYGPPSSPSGPPHATFTWSPSTTDYSHSLVSPLIDAAGASEGILVDFLLFLNNYNDANINKMAVEFKSVDDDDWILLEEFSSEGQGSNNIEFAVEGELLSGMAGQVFQLRFRANGENSFSINGWGLDDIHVYAGGGPEPCLQPTGLSVTDITDTNALIDWQAGGTEVEWNLVYGETGFDPDEDGFLVEGITEKPYSLSELQHNTDYGVYVRAVCGDELSPWSEPVHFSTEPTIYIVNATASEHGNIDPEGEIEVVKGESLYFTFMPDIHYHIQDVSVDGVSVMDEVEMEDGLLGEGLYYMAEIEDHHDIHVEFAVNQYHVSVAVEPADGGTVTGDGAYEWNSEVTLEASAAADYMFLHWTEAGVVVHDEDNYTFIVEDERELVAHFQLTVDVDAISGYSGVSIYPNPATDKLQVAFTDNRINNVRIILLNLQGQVVLEHNVMEGDDLQEYSISLEGIDSGIYLLQVDTAAGSHHEKLIIR